MKRVVKLLLKIFLIVIALIVLAVFAFLKIAEHREANYYNYTQTAGAIETEYAALGGMNVSYLEFNAINDVIGKYAVWYPVNWWTRRKSTPL